MSIYIKNNSGGDKTYLGQLISNASYYLVQPQEKTAWANDSLLLTDIGNGDAIVSKSDNGNEDITDINEGINYLKGLAPAEVKTHRQAFAEKTLIDGKKLYKRFQGSGFIDIAAGATEVIDIEITYDQVKMEAVEIINSNGLLTVDLKVYDTDNTFVGGQGYYSGTGLADIMLNQFGFDVHVPKDYYRGQSQYDSDLYKGMFLTLEITNHDSSPCNKVGFNLDIQEVKA